MAKNNSERLSQVFDNIRESFDDRMTSLRQNLNETQMTLKKFKEDHKNMSQELKSYLKKYAGDLKTGNQKRIDDFRKFYKGLSKENSQAAQELRIYLKRYNIDRLQDFFDFIDPLKNELQNLHQVFMDFQRHTAKVRTKPLLAYTKLKRSAVPQSKTGRKRHG